MPKVNRRAMLLGAAGLAVSASAAAARTGVVAAVVPPRPAPALYPGLDIEVGQTISTGPGELVNVLFVDGTSVTVGPESSMRIDNCVFDPARGKGELALTLRSGTCQLTCGAIGRAGEISVATPAGSVGVHDTIMALSATDKATICLVERGQGRVREVPIAAVSRGSLAQAGTEDDACSTLVDFVVVISIVGIVAALALPAITSALHKGQVKGTLNNARQLQLATQQMSLESTTTGDTAVGWPGDLTKDQSTEANRAFAGFSRLSDAITTAQATPSDASALVDRVMANTDLTRQQRRQLVRSAHETRTGTAAAGNPGAHPPGVVQRISTAITSRPYQATFPSKQ